MDYRLAVDAAVNFRWVPRLLHWVILVAGRVAECVFLIGGVWLSVNASVHTFVLLFLSESQTRSVTGLVTSLYVALPELILGLAIVTTLGQFKMWRYNKADHIPLIWGILYGIPAIIFLVISVTTLGNSVANTGFTLPLPLVILRAIAGFSYAFTSLLYTELGKPKEVERLQGKDRLIAQLQGNAATKEQEYQTECNRANSEIATLKRELTESINGLSAANNALIKSNRIALEADAEGVSNWLSSGVKTVNLDEITRYTGHSKRRLMGAITRGDLLVSPRNKELILVSSLVGWLESNPSMTETNPRLRLVNE